MARRSCWARASRILRHRWWDERDVARLLPPSSLDRLQAQIAASEQGHTGEIRVCVEGGLPLSYLWRDASPRERAVAMFGKLRVWDTEANNGVLIYLLLAERVIELVADRGIARRVPAAQWQAVVAELRAPLQSARAEEGLSRAITRVDALLRAHFPRNAGSGDRNELPDRPHLGHLG
jgi:hypothetical protein